MKILVHNGSDSFRVPVPRGLKVTAYSSGLFFAGDGTVAGRFDFFKFHARGFEVVPLQSCTGPGMLVSWTGGPVADSAFNFWITCE